jgi:hypothetical protein
MKMKAKPLSWTSTQKNHWYADSPFSKYFVITFVQNYYWAAWDLNIQGMTDFEEIKQKAEEAHQKAAAEFLQKHYG